MERISGAKKLLLLTVTPAKRKQTLFMGFKDQTPSHTCQRLLSLSNMLYDGKKQRTPWGIV